MSTSSLTYDFKIGTESCCIKSVFALLDSIPCKVEWEEEKEEQEGKKKEEQQEQVAEEATWKLIVKFIK